MVFSNSVFLFLFLPIALAVYYCPFCRNIKFRNLWLLMISVFFYAWGEPVYVGLLVVSIIVNWALGLWQSRHKKTKMGKFIVLLASVYNLGVLVVFKYLGWLLGIFDSGNVFANLVLPVGISFYTFQAMSYAIDVYRGKEEAQKNILNVGLYIAFFPQITSGPIVKYGTMAKQITGRTHSFELFSEGIWRFIIGLSKKVILANQISIVAEKAFAMEASQLSIVFAWAGALAYMLQIYFDFSGYSDMAIGLANMFGFKFSENFNYPYISKSVSEYWRRWHISLGEWFRDYLYYPLSIGPAIKLRKTAVKKMNKKTAAMISNSFVLLVVWMSTGIWHGANWTFIVWGLIQFVCIFYDQYHKPLKNKKLGAFFGFVCTFFIVLLTKVIFNSPDMTSAMSYYGSMLGLNGNPLVDNYGLYWIGQYRLYMIVGFIFCFPVLEQVTKYCKGKKLQPVWETLQTASLCCLLFICICYTIGGGYNPFIYFNF